MTKETHTGAAEAEPLLYFESLSFSVGRRVTQNSE
jgi:hypothetical protein